MQPAGQSEQQAGCMRPHLLAGVAGKVKVKGIRGADAAVNDSACTPHGGRYKDSWCLSHHCEMSKAKSG